jgi:hypothetical protein
LINASPSIDSITTLADSATSVDSGATDSHEAVAVNVSMNIGANGTLKIESGGLRLPSNPVVGDE